MGLFSTKRGRARRRARRKRRGGSRLGVFLRKSAAPLAKAAVGAAATFIPGGTVALAGAEALGVTGGTRGKALAPSGFMPSAPRGTAAAVPPMGTTSGPGLLPRGPGEKLQWPWKDPSPMAAVKAWSLDDRYLKVYHRAPPGYVVAKDDKGRPYCLKKEMARLYGWKPKKKPPISVRDWSALKRSYSTVRKLKKVVHMAKTVGNRRKALAF